LSGEVVHVNLIEPQEKPRSSEKIEMLNVVNIINDLVCYM